MDSDSNDNKKNAQPFSLIRLAFAMSLGVVIGGVAGAGIGMALFAAFDNSIFLYICPGAGFVLGTSIGAVLGLRHVRINDSE